MAEALLFRLRGLTLSFLSGIDLVLRCRGGMLFSLFGMFLEHLHLVLAANLAHLGEVKPQRADNQRVCRNQEAPRHIRVIGPPGASAHGDQRADDSAAEHAPPNALVLFVLSRRRIVILAVELGLLLASGLLRSFLFLRSLLRGLHVHARRGFRLRLERRGRFLSLALRSVGLIAVVHRVSCAHMDTFLLENTW